MNPFLSPVFKNSSHVQSGDSSTFPKLPQRLQQNSSNPTVTVATTSSYAAFPRYPGVLFKPREVLLLSPSYGGRNWDESLHFPKFHRWEAHRELDQSRQCFSIFPGVPINAQDQWEVSR